TRRPTVTVRWRTIRGASAWRSAAPTAASTSRSAAGATTAVTAAASGAASAGLFFFLGRVFHPPPSPPPPHPPTHQCRPTLDAPLDPAWNAIDWNRDLQLSVEQTRRREIDNKLNGKGRGVGTVAFPDLRRGRVGIFIATLLARLHRPGMMPAFTRYDNMNVA